jgi:hypothetical protein
VARAAHQKTSEPHAECRLLRSRFQLPDNGKNNRPDKSTVYLERPRAVANFPSKIPDRWGRAVLADVPAQATFEFSPGSHRHRRQPGDWNLSSYSKVRGGDDYRNIALIGFDTDGVLYKAGYATTLSLPENASDHTATVYGRYDASYLYFIVRLAVKTSARLSAPRCELNDAVELYIDPDRGLEPDARLDLGRQRDYVPAEKRP